MQIGFVGPGKVGCSLGAYLKDHGQDVRGYCGQDRARTQEAADFTKSRRYDALRELVRDCTLIFLTVPDGAIADVWQDVRRCDLKGKIICHCSGALTSAVFSGIDEAGAYGFSVHPLLAVSSRFDSSRDIQNALFTMEGNEQRKEEILSLLTSCGNRAIWIDASVKTRYHAAAVLASNLAVGLYDAAERLLCTCGFSEDDAKTALGPLIRGNVENVLEKGCIDALTGPVERNDTETLRRHLRELDGRTEDIYRILSGQVVGIAKQKHPQEDYSAMEALLTETLRTEG